MLMFNRSTDPESQDKNALVCMSMTEEPTSVDITRHESSEKVCNLQLFLGYLF